MTDMSGFEFGITCEGIGHGRSSVHGEMDEFATHLVTFDCDNCVFISEAWFCVTYVEGLYSVGLVQCPLCQSGMAVEGSVTILGTVGV